MLFTVTHDLRSGRGCCLGRSGARRYTAAPLSLLLQSHRLPLNCGTTWCCWALDHRPLGSGLASSVPAQLVKACPVPLSLPSGYPAFHSSSPPASPASASVHPICGFQHLLLCLIRCLVRHLRFPSLKSLGTPPGHEEQILLFLMPYNGTQGRPTRLQ